MTDKVCPCCLRPNPSHASISYCDPCNEDRCGAASRDRCGYLVYEDEEEEEDS